jgi:hypothetical protein
VQIRPNVQQLLDAMSDAPVFVQNGRLDAVATNPLGAALFSEMIVRPQRPMNAARFIFLDPRAQTIYRDWKATPVRSSHCCEPKPADHRMTGSSPTSSPSSPPAATSSAPCGDPWITLATRRDLAWQRLRFGLGAVAIFAAEDDPPRGHLAVGLRACR